MCQLIPVLDYSRANIFVPSQRSVDEFILSLSLTQLCNLHCPYCYQKNGRLVHKSVMSYDVAIEAIDEYLTRQDDFKHVTIELLGGEVFLHWELVRQIVEWTLNNRVRWRKSFTFFIDTNGTLLNEEIKSWLYQRRSVVVVGLSLDGTREAQNINRSNSFDSIVAHIPFFAAAWPQQTVKMTISPSTIPMIFDGILALMKDGLMVAANLPAEDIWGSPLEKGRLLSEFKVQIERLVGFFAAHCDLPVPSLIDLPLRRLLTKDPSQPWCGAGRNMVAVQYDGTRLPCNRFDSMSFDQTIFKRETLKAESKCDNCPFKPACPTCEAHNWTMNGHPAIRTSYHCEFVKIQLWGTAQVRTTRIERQIMQTRSVGTAALPSYSPHLEELRAAFATLTNLTNEGVMDEHGNITLW